MTFCRTIFRCLSQFMRSESFASRLEASRGHAMHVYACTCGRDTGARGIPDMEVVSPDRRENKLMGLFISSPAPNVTQRNL